MSERLNYKQKINKILDDVNPGDAEFKLNVSERYIRPRVKSWKADVMGQGFYEDHVNRYAYREFIPTEKKYIINREETIEQIEHRVLSLIDGVFKLCSPNKAPRRTKIYKSFRTILYANKGRIDFMNSVFDIAEYYKSVTTEKAIATETNDVHRKNIYQLLCLMEKNYGSKREENSNG